MTTTLRTTALAATTAFATVLTALVLGSTSGQAGEAPVVHQLPRVVVTGQVQRATPVIAELPRVVVTGTVQTPRSAQVVELPRVVVTGRRVVDGTVMAQAGRIAASGG
jgi:hypothetical protein